MSVPHYNQRWIEINADALTNNVHVLKTVIGQTKLMAVVKANAYGHDASLVAPILCNAGADAFGVTTFDEALVLLKAGINSSTIPILCFAPIADPEALEYAIENSLHLTICDLPSLKLAQDAETKAGKPANLHLKIDTGMGRLGLKKNDATSVLTARKEWAGLYTHFANVSAKSPTSTLAALKDFNSTIKTAKAKKVAINTAHCANSAAVLRFPNSRLDMVRVGTALYGQMPSEYVPKPDGLRADTFALKARVLQVKELRRGDTVGYGAEFKAPKSMRVAVVPVGFADGFGIAPTSLYSGLRGLSRVLKGSGDKQTVWINDYPALVIGRVAMQMIVVDLAQVTSEVEAGTIVDVPIRRLAAGALIPRVLVKG